MGRSHKWLTWIEFVLLSTVLQVKKRLYRASLIQPGPVIWRSELQFIYVPHGGSLVRVRLLHIFANIID